MTDMSIITFYWNVLINQIGRLGLPVDKHIVAYVMIALLVYALGYISKSIAGTDD